MPSLEDILKKAGKAVKSFEEGNVLEKSKTAIKEAGQNYINEVVETEVRLQTEGKFPQETISQPEKPLVTIPPEGIQEALDKGVTKSSELTELDDVRFAKTKDFTQAIADLKIAEFYGQISPEEAKKTRDELTNIWGQAAIEFEQDFWELVAQEGVENIALGGAGLVLGGLKDVSKLTKYGKFDEWPGFVKDWWNKKRALSMKTQEILSEINIETPSQRNLEALGLEDSVVGQELAERTTFKPYVAFKDIKVDIEGKTYTDEEIINLAQEVLDNPKTANVSLQTQEVVRQMYTTSVQYADDLARKLALDPDNEKLLADFNTAVAKNYELSVANDMIKGAAARALSHQRRVPGTDSTSAGASVLSADENFRKATSKVLKNLSKEEAIKVNGMLIKAKGNPDEVRRILAEYTASKHTDKMLEYIINGMLSNPKTHLRNIMGNSVNITSRVMRMPIEASVDAARHFLTGKERTVFFSEIPGAIKALRKSGPEAVKQLGDDIKTLLSGGSVQQIKQSEFQFLPKISGKAGSVIRFPTGMLAAEDNFFRKVVSDLEEARFVAKAKAGRVLTPKQKAKAIEKEVLETLFQKELGTVGKAAQNLINSNPALKIFFPFFKTPINLFKEGVKHTPVGFINAFLAHSDKFPKEASKAILGTGIMTPLVVWATGKSSQGLPNIIGAAPTNEAERDAFYRAGMVPHSIRMGNSYVPYRDFEPFSTMFDLVANTAEQYNQTGEIDPNLMAGATTALIRNFADKSSMQTLGQAYQAIFFESEYDKFERLRGFFEGKATAIIPNVVQSAARGLDPEIRQQDSLKDRFQAVLPFVSRMLPARNDLFGQPLERQSGFLGAVISPIVPNKIELNLLDQELMRLKQPIGAPARTVVGVRLNQEAYEEMKVVRGAMLQSKIWDIMNTDAYVNATDKEKAQVLKNVESKIDKAAGLLFLFSNQPLLQESFMQEKSNQINVFKDLLSIEPGYADLTDGQLEEIVVKNLDKLNEEFNARLDAGQMAQYLFAVSQL